MPDYDFRSPRLFVEEALSAGGTVPLSAAQAHYLQNVLRLRVGADLLLFNGRDGEWLARLSAQSRKSSAAEVLQQTRTQTPGADLHYLFAPIKHARLDYMVQKAVEMGVSKLQPVFTRRAQVSRLNTERMRANAIEAAEQCGILSLAEVAEPAPLDQIIEAVEPERLLIFCDERADVQDPLAALERARPSDQPPRLAVLIGPEGGFAPEEREMLLRHPRVVRIALGPRILRADTAAVAALAVVQAVLGDWRPTA
jgi:16S rRNA (uracil1498-N3)-methyltransferase